ncbi:MAG: TIGR03790 family protein [Nitrospirae bacterium]|nr:TIGR03790 family protein [Nitrospirota bacterium]
MNRLLLTVLSAALIMIITAGPAGAVVKPEEVLIVVNSESADSVRLGRLYAELRRIPSTRLVEIKAPVQDYISRRQYDELIAGPLREAIDRMKKNGKKIRCLVTVFGVPLKISAVTPPDVSREEVGKRKEVLEKKTREKKGLERQYEENKEDKNISGRLEQIKAEINGLQFELDRIVGDDTIAAVDSELALLLSPSYKLAGWRPNPDFVAVRGRLEDPPHALMVSRLDASSPEVVEKMMRTAVAVEKTGLAGKFYLDARGYTGNKSEYAKFDEDIRRTAQVLGKGRMPVVLDNRQELFGPGDAPAAALYCGWYSHGQYIDAFQWSEGAVGYHVASSEAVSLHEPKAKYWVKSMLDRGVIASIGPVAEPYLTSFPPPSIFFQLLMSGQYSLVEVFAMSNPFLSWRMILLGDPLYNPFKVEPAYPLKGAPSPPE